MVFSCTIALTMYCWPMRSLLRTTVALCLAACLALLTACSGDAKSIDRADLTYDCLLYTSDAADD